MPKPDFSNSFSALAEVDTATFKDEINEHLGRSGVDIEFEIGINCRRREKFSQLAYLPLLSNMPERWSMRFFRFVRHQTKHRHSFEECANNL